MRFFEFKLPEPGSDFANELASYLTKLIQTARSLPEDDPRRMEFNELLQSLKSQAGVAEDAVADTDQATVNAILSFLSKKGDKVATRYLMDAAEILGDTSVQAALKAKENEISKREQEKSQEISKVKLDKAKAVAVTVGKQESWGRDLIGILDRYENDQLVNDFMDLVLSGKGLTQKIITEQPILKVNLKQIINPKISGIFDNKEVFVNLALLPFAEQKAGFGGGVGPGEALFAMLIPKAKRAPGGSDLEIDGKIWEVKGGGSDTSKAWLDSATVAPSELRKKFDSIASDALKSQFRKKITFSDGSVFTLSQVLDLADFREEKFRYLRMTFRLLDMAENRKIISEMYSMLFPSVKKKEKELFTKYVKNSIDAILVGNRRLLADIQAKLAMLEYGLGSYRADNFIVYNYNTNEVILIRGIDGIIDSIDNKDNLVRTETITMGGAKKSSPGITLVSKPSRRKPKQYD